MKIQAKFTALSLVVIAIVGTNAAATYQSVKTLDGYTDTLAKLSLFSVKQMEVDMMHDAIRGDVAKYNQAGLQNNIQSMQEAPKEFSEHKTRTLDGLKELEDENVTPEITQLFNEVRSQFNDYFKFASAVMATPIQDPSLAQKNKAFDEQFSKLEKSQEDLGDKVAEQKKYVGGLQDAETTATITRLAIFSALSMALCIALPTYAIMGMFRPQRKMIAIIQSVSQGDTDVDLEKDIKRKDEMGELARTIIELAASVDAAYRLKQMVQDMPVNVMTVDIHNDFKINYANETALATLKGLETSTRTKSHQVIGSAVDILYTDAKFQRSLMADKNKLPHRSRIQIGGETMEQLIAPINNKQGEYIGAMLTWNNVTAQEKLASDFEQSVKGIVNIVASAATELSQTAENMVSLVSESTKLAGDASQAAGKTNANVQSVASASEELSASIKDISAQLQRTADLVSVSNNKAGNADTLASSLTTASDKVSAAMELITSISGQINMLALNATIESARAGDAGKGFAVVAGEVKTLAGQTDKSITEIHSVVEDMRNASQQIVGALGEIRDSINMINEAAVNVASAVEQQSATTNEIARSIQVASQDTNVISLNLDNVSTASTQAGSAAEQMLAASKDLSKQAEALSSQVDNFLTKMRAA